MQNEESGEGKSRFNLRKLNIPPLKRDHSRSVDYSKTSQASKQFKEDYEKER